MDLLWLAAFVFVVLHMGVAGTGIRGVLTGVLGARFYMVVFSAASIAAIIFLATAYKDSPYVAVLAPMNWWKALTDVLMLPAFLLVVVGLATPNPTMVGGERVPPRATGIVRITRHPFLMGVALWAILHLVANGDEASIILFGALLLVSVAGAHSIDAKRRRALGPAWEAFARETSIVPFGAIAAGRNHLSLREIGWQRPLVGLLAYVIFIGGHRHIIGVSPFPTW